MVFISQKWDKSTLFICLDANEPKIKHKKTKAFPNAILPAFVPPPPHKFNVLCVRAVPPRIEGGKWDALEEQEFLPSFCDQKEGPAEGEKRLKLEC